LQACAACTLFMFLSRMTSSKFFMPRMVTVCGSKVN
jgi:hypothetical protein